MFFLQMNLKNLLTMKNSDYVLSLGDLKNLGIDFPINCKKATYIAAYISKNNSNLKKYDLNIVGFIPPFMKSKMSTPNIKKNFFNLPKNYLKKIIF